VVQGTLHGVVVVRGKQRAGEPGAFSRCACPALFHPLLHLAKRLRPCPLCQASLSRKISHVGGFVPVARGPPVTLHVPGAWEDLAVGAVEA
jgi:hypothetical protein